MSYLNRIEHPHYYNDFSEESVEWLRELMKHGHIPPGEIDGRSILDVCVSDLKGFRQAHFFAGIAGWPLALRLAGVPPSFPLWTGSPPCQPFSVAGRQEGKDDERHLAPHFLDLVRGARPGVLFGEQVASAEVFGKAPKRARGNAVSPPDWAWIDDVSERLEAARYSIGTNDFPSSSVGAPHIRQRTYFGAVSDEWLEQAKSVGRIEWWTQSGELGAGVGCSDCGMADCCCCSGSLPGSQSGIHRGEEVPGSRDGEPERFSSDGGLGDGDNERLEGRGESKCECSDERSSWSSGLVDGLVNTNGRQTSTERQQRSREQRQQQEDRRSGELVFIGRSSPVNGFWGTADWLFCRDDRWRPVEPGSQPLAHGISGRVGLLRGYGNGINSRQAALYIKAFFEALAIITHDQRESLPDLGIDGLIV